MCSVLWNSTWASQSNEGKKSPDPQIGALLFGGFDYGALVNAT